MGDVLAIRDGAGNIVAEYTYDAYGKVLSVTDGSGNDVSTDRTHIANINPIRYRSYYYDAETGFYYLQSRYYDPETGRFLNADGYVSTGQGILGYNMFAYCGNNPVLLLDPTGTCYFCEKAKEKRQLASKCSEYNNDWLMLIEDAEAYENMAIIEHENIKEGQSSTLTVAQTIYGEAGGRYAYPEEWQEGQLAVATVIANRALSHSFPNNLSDVCTQASQFSGYARGKKAYENGNFDKIMWDNAILLAWSMQNGYSVKHPSLTSDYLYFYSEKYGNQDTIAKIKAKRETVILGGNMFYKNW